MSFFDSEENDRNVSISAVGAALIALEDELNTLERESEMHHTRMRLAHTKMDICRAAIHKLLVNTVGPLYAISSTDTKTDLDTH